MEWTSVKEDPEIGQKYIKIKCLHTKATEAVDFKNFIYSFAGSYAQKFKKYSAIAHFIADLFSSGIFFANI